MKLITFFSIYYLQFFLYLVLVFTVSPILNAEQTKFGVILPLSGAIAEIGEDIKNGITLAKLDADKDNLIQFIFEDDQFVAKNTVNAIHKLINVDKVRALITFGGSTSNSVAEIAERNKIPMLAITALTTIGLNKNYVYSVFISASSQSDVLAEGLAKHGISKLAVVTNTQDALIHLRNEFIKKFQGQIVFNDEILPGELNISTIITKIKATEAQAVLLLTLPPHNAMFASKLREQGFDGQFFGAVPMYNPSELKSAGDTLIGARVPAPWSKKLAAYNVRYKDKYGRIPISEGYYAYDIATSLIEAAKSKDINSFLKSNVHLNGIAGKYVRNEQNAYEAKAVLKKVSQEYVLE